jgi:hypothetical protein
MLKKVIVHTLFTAFTTDKRIQQFKMLKLGSPLYESFSCQFLTYSLFLHNITNFSPKTHAHKT